MWNDGMKAVKTKSEAQGDPLVAYGVKMKERRLAGRPYDKMDDWMDER